MHGSRHTMAKYVCEEHEYIRMRMEEIAAERLAAQGRERTFEDRIRDTVEKFSGRGGGSSGDHFVSIAVGISGGAGGGNGQGGCASGGGNAQSAPATPAPPQT